MKRKKRTPRRATAAIVHRPGAPVPDAVTDYRACAQADALMSIWGLRRRCPACGGTGTRERLSDDGTHTIATRCPCRAEQQ